MNDILVGELYRFTEEISCFNSHKSKFQMPKDTLALLIAATEVHSGYDNIKRISLTFLIQGEVMELFYFANAENLPKIEKL